MRRRARRQFGSKRKKTGRGIAAPWLKLVAVGVWEGPGNVETYLARQLSTFAGVHSSRPV